MNTHADSATTADLDHASDFVAHGARLIDRYRFAHLFAGGDPEPVRAALAAYANPDGGFGNALEPDLRGPDSQTLPAQHALEILLGELHRPDDPLVAGVLDWLVGVTQPEGGVAFVLPTAYAYPRAPWFAAGGEAVANLNPTAALAAILLAHGVEHPWLERATAFCWQGIEALTESGSYELRAILPFLDHVPDRDRAARALERIAPFVHANVTLDPAEGGMDKHRPLDFAPRPDGLGRTLFADATIEANLDAVVAGQRDDGGWQVDWLIWTPATELEWRGVMTIHQLSILRAYGRL